MFTISELLFLSKTNKMRLKPIRTEEEYEVMLAWIDSQFNLGVPFESPEGESLQVALLLIKAYEDAHYPVQKIHKNNISTK